jgi:hypothetical protein
MTGEIDYGLLDMHSERTKMINWIAHRIVIRGNVPPEDAMRAATVVFWTFWIDLRDADSYRWLRDEIMKTMPDPDGWDYDEAEPSALMRYIEHMATATHGDCDRCGRRVMAGEHFELVDRTPSGDPVIVCMECI